jgi:hypothetical protein
MATAQRDTTMTTMAMGDDDNDVDGDGATDSEVDSVTGDDNYEDDDGLDNNDGNGEVDGNDGDDRDNICFWKSLPLSYH